ncbi:MAG: hypothetical protein DWB45_06210 [Xanthomonadales bacterium]|nr:hypothetical protein [Xanthomonadales bacterium]
MRRGSAPVTAAGRAATPIIPIGWAGLRVARLRISMLLSAVFAAQYALAGGFLRAAPRAGRLRAAAG